MKTLVHKLALPNPGQRQLEFTAPQFTAMHVAMQKGKAYLWYHFVEGTGPERVVEFTCIGTGWDLPTEEYWFHVGTLLSENETYVWHYFARYVPERN